MSLWSAPGEGEEARMGRANMQGKTWKHASPDQLAHVRGLLLRRGAVEDRDLKNPSEAWRVRIDKVVFMGYRSGTIYCNGGTIPELPFLYKSISESLGQS